ncbi:MAG TPA: hypothetical protein VGT40_22785 [Methylomirabilota bacterium]|jgi:hypothetical protein|nr:hypothetical protein [Methylomirabilota bacterium]
MTIQYLDPTVAPESSTKRMAARPPTLDGKAVGLLANGKVNGDRLLELVAEGLAGRYQLRGVVALAKDNASRPAPPELIDELTRLSDVVVTAIGD